MAENKNSRIIILVLLALLIGAAGLLYFQKQSNEEMVAGLTQEKESLKMELSELAEQYNVLLEDSDSLNRTLIAERDRILNLMDSIDNLQGDIRVLRRYRAEVFKLKKENKELLDRADSLIVVNRQLEAEKQRVEENLQQSEERNAALTDENRRLDDEVNLGKRLQAYEIISGAVRVRGDKEKTTDRASKADKIKTCFMLSENLIADAGDKVVYIRILEPNGNLMGKGMEEYAIQVDGEKILCSEKKTFFYENEALDLCVYVDLPENTELAEGEYKVEVYMDSAKIGESTFDLRNGWL